MKTIKKISTIVVAVLAVVLIGAGTASAQLRVGWGFLFPIPIPLPIYQIPHEPSPVTLGLLFPIPVPLPFYDYPYYERASVREAPPYQHRERITGLYRQESRRAIPPFTLTAGSTGIRTTTRPAITRSTCLSAVIR